MTTLGEMQGQLYRRAAIARALGCTEVAQKLCAAGDALNELLCAHDKTFYRNWARSRDPHRQKLGQGKLDLWSSEASVG